MLDELVDLGGRARGADVDERLGESVGTAPEANPDRARVVFVDGGDDGLRSGGGLAGAGGGDAVGRLPGSDALVEIVGLRPALGVEQQIGPHLSVGLDERVHGFGMGRGLLPSRGGGDEGFDVEFVGIHEQANEGHLIVGLVADIADDDDAGFSGEVVDVGWWNGLGER